MSTASDFIIENTCLIRYIGSGGDVVIPEGVTAIGDNAFEGCESLKSIAIPDSVTAIGAGAFEGCCSLSIELQSRIKAIAPHAFD